MGERGLRRGLSRLGLPVALFSLTLLAAWPLLRAGYPTIGDGQIHFYRLVQLDNLLRSGVWFPRWATDLGFGFGYPVFNYYSPLAYYLGALLHAAGLSYAHALLGAYVAALALAVTGAYALAAHRWGQAAGLVAAAAYGLAPYFYFNALARGALPETLGLGLLPWVLWAYARLARQLRPAWFMLAALLNATLVLTHTLSAVLAAGLIVVVVSAAQSANYRLLLADYTLSLGLAAFFLLPAVLELGAVQAGQLTQPGDLDFHNNFLELGELLAWPQPYDARLVFNAVPASLSLAAVAVALLSWAAGAWPKARSAAHPAQLGRHGPRTSEGWALASALLVLVLLTLPVSVWVWERVPLLALVQFPWRLVGPASLLLALLAGAGVGRAARGPLAGRPRALAATVALSLAGLWAFSLAWSFGPASQAPATAGLAELRAYEQTTGQLGTTSAGEFLPKAVRTLPDPHALEAAYGAGRPGARLAALPAGISVLAQTAGATGATAEVDAAVPATLTFNYFDFPGWRATVDGRAVPITPSDPHGLITVPVPAGPHRVAVRFGATPLRTAASALSVVALAVLILLARRLSHTPTPPHSDAPIPPHSFTPAPLFTLTALLAITVRALLLDSAPSVFARSRFDGATVAGAQNALDVNFDDELVLIGLDGLPARVAADEPVELTLYWRAQTVPAADYASTVQVLDTAGHLYGQSDSQHPGRTPTSRWRPDQYARDTHTLRLLPGTPPGTYQVVAGIYPVEGPALAVLDANHVPQGQTTLLGTLTVTRARRPAVPDAAQPLEADLGALTLLGYSLNTISPQAGDELRLTLFWRAAEAARPDVAVRLALVSDSGAVLAEDTQAPAQPGYPTSAWAVGEVVRAPRQLRVPASVPAGPATLQVSAVPALPPSGPPLAGPATLATLDLRVPTRAFAAPAMPYTLNAAVGGQVTLLGYDLAPTGALTLYWQARAPLDVSYKVFVHVLGGSEQILAQADSVPAQGTRPTTGWLPGEVVADTHALSLTGATHLAVGLYAEASGERLGRIVIELP